mgnify:CR=1 FL=1
MSITEFDKWKEALGKAVNIGENFGMSDNTINKYYSKCWFISS